MLDQKTRKLKIIEEVLHLESDQGLEQLESVLDALKITLTDEGIPAMPTQTPAQINADFEQALLEARDGDVYTHEQVVAMAQRRRAA